MRMERADVPVAIIDSENAVFSILSVKGDVSCPSG
jgi:hypothetical protein